MAAKSTIGKRYARAFAEIVSDTTRASAAQAELESLVHTLSDDVKLSAFLKSPVFSREEKWSVLSELLAKSGTSKETTQFLKTILEADRVLLLEDILAEFKKVLMNKLGEAEAHIESAYALTETELSTIQANLEKTIGKKLRISVETNPALVAGLRVNVDGKTFDATLATHLTRLQRQLSRAEA
ncbi:MAG: ATP synthase F1 subunit delta [Bdellovibrionota bacterium]